MIKRKKCLLAIVCYYPNLIKLEEILKQFFSVDVVIYNNGGVDLKWSEERNIYILGTSCNVGLGVSCNDIFEYAINRRYEYLILSDQDTLYPGNYVCDMLQSIENCDDAIAILPAWLDNNSSDKKIKGQYIYGPFGLSLKENFTDIAEISHGIMSGMVVDVSKLDNTTMMNSDLFIDWVDTEWFWRIKQTKKLKTFYNPNVCLHHELGSGRKKILGRDFTVRNPSRDYYIIRNSLFLLLYSRLQFAFRKYIFLKFIHHIIMSFVYYYNDEAKVQFIFKALKDGFRKNMGKCNA